jgi:nicotinamide-nucleotide amidase
MKTEVLAVGSELLTADFQDTNSLYLAERLASIGLRFSFKTVVGDDDRDLARAVRSALSRSRLVIAMGGLGPTEDDRTREAFARALGRRLVFHPDILRTIEARFRRRGLAAPASNRKQAYVLRGAEALGNPNGTAPGQWLETDRNIVVLLPGPAHELKPMFEDFVLPRLRRRPTASLVRRVLRLTGLGESLMESRIADVYGALPSGVVLTTLASPGDLAIHIIAQGTGGPERLERKIEAVEHALLQRLGDFVYSRDDKSLPEVVGAGLLSRGETLACAESCTGGLLGHRVTGVPGSSAYFLASVVAYANRIKEDFLGVSKASIGGSGAVSSAVAAAMAEGVRARAKSTYGLGITGVAGPGGGTMRKPVGLVYTALAGPDGVTVARNLFFGGRDHVKFQATQKALDMLRRRLGP